MNINEGLRKPRIKLNSLGLPQDICFLREAYSLEQLKDVVSKFGIDKFKEYYKGSTLLALGYSEGDLKTIGFSDKDIEDAVTANSSEF